MYNLSNNKQLTNNKQHSIGSHGKQQLLFPLVHLILRYVPHKDEIKEG
jgi:hypothetical protein